MSAEARSERAPADAVPRMFELQLGHLCNDRCVFCISGRITQEGEAKLLPLAPLEARLRQAHAEGHRELTFLGGEPTIQPVFLPLLRLAVALGFERIVIFSNGSMAGRSDLVEQVAAVGGHVEWRFSFHGGNEAAHEATTRRKGSFAQLMRAIERVHAQKQRITVNACVVAQNYASLGEFAALLAPYDVEQLHVDMIHPEDTGNLSLDELRPMMVRYTEVAPHLRKMIGGFAPTFRPGFDVNVGNVPYCVAPDLAPWIHHGGPATVTTQTSDFGLPVLQPGRDKYAFKERQKVKISACRTCAHDGQCSGLFPEYAAIYGTDELSPVSHSIDDASPRARAALVRWQRAAPFGQLHWSNTRLEEQGRRLVLTLTSGEFSFEAWAGEQGSGYRLERGGAEAVPSSLQDDLRRVFLSLRTD